jgi:hypothetical protein
VTKIINIYNYKNGKENQQEKEMRRGRNRMGKSGLHSSG